MGLNIPLQASAPEDVFAQLFCETFGPESAQYLTPQFPFQDIYGRGRFIDYALRASGEQFAFEIDSAIYHAPGIAELEKWEDDLLRQNSLVHDGWRVFRWTDRQLAEEQVRICEELLLFLQGTRFSAPDDYLPLQRGAMVDLRDYQQDALRKLAELRADGISIALLTQAQGTGKTTVAVEDARSLHQRTLFVAHTRELVKQAHAAFARLWPEVGVEVFPGDGEWKSAQAVVGTVQAVSAQLAKFGPADFGYLIIDEAHHATAESYQKVIGYFRTQFMLGLTATPFRADSASVLKVFQNVAHRISLEEAIKRGYLVPIRCVRVRTNVDMRDVRFNGVKYNTRDLETRLIVEDRDRLIVDTYRNHVLGKRAVAFCVNINHAERLAQEFRATGIPAQAVSGTLAKQHREERLQAYHNGAIHVLCACDLLNEGWDSPETEVLLMARPTLSRVVYLQQLGRGTRRSEGKECLIVFDFVDNATMLNRGISLHSVWGKKEYHPGGLVQAPDELLREEARKFAAGERPQAVIALSLWVTDIESVDIFDWRQEVENMLSAARLSVELGVDEGTVSNWIGTGKIQPDLVVPLGKRSYHFFRHERVPEYRQIFNLRVVTAEVRKEAFMDFALAMDMSASYKPVLMLAMLDLADDRGRLRVADLVAAFKGFYLDRAAKDLPIEKQNVRMSQVIQMNDALIERLIFSMPFERFERRIFVKRLKEIEFVAFVPEVWRRLTAEDKAKLRRAAEEHITRYYAQEAGEV